MGFPVSNCQGKNPFKTPWVIVACFMSHSSENKIKWENGKGCLINPGAILPTRILVLTCCSLLWRHASHCLPSRKETVDDFSPALRTSRTVSNRQPHFLPTGSCVSVQKEGILNLFFFFSHTSHTDRNLWQKGQCSEPEPEVEQILS